MLVWRGWGAIILLQFVLWVIFVPIAGLSAFPPVPGGTPADAYHRWITDKQFDDLWIAIAGLGSALTCLAMALYRKSHPISVKDPDTGEVVIIPRIDDLWYVELQYWPLIFGAPGLIALVLTPFNIGPG
jgi:hypothetical protein